MHGRRALLIPAHAKLNLCLAVGPPEPATTPHATANPRAGWHPICTWMAPITLADELLLQIARPPPAPAAQTCDLTITWGADAPRPSPINWPTHKDLAFCAHAALERHLGRQLPVRATLTKRTPVGGGLGGGSADAAAMLVGLNQLFDLRLPLATLAALALPLGSDVPFLLRADPAAAPAPALVESFGDVRAPLAPVDAQIILFFPPFGCETRAVYRAYDAAPRQGVDRAAVLAAHASALAASRINAAALFNDLSGPAQAVQPALTALLDALTRATGQRIHITGSGSTLFALADAPGQPAKLLAAAAALGLPALPTRLC